MMKKNISINISGIIFHIEEDAFDRLRDYLDAVNRYFSTFDGSQEIIADIESRIAEIFLSRLHEEKQIITLEDVDALIATMGTIEDFQAIEERDTDEPKAQGYTHSQQQWSESGTRKLYRDEGRKLLGGVCAGIAHYFKIDPLWVRLIAILLFLGSYGVIIIAYLVLWIALPAHDLPEDQTLKKMYRNPENKVIAGVCSGVAAYFGIDVAVVRLLFVILTLLGGTGLIAYIILWIILPEAKSITDRVQMQGDPVTLSNIEANIKKSLNVKEGEENLLVKILLFPFRLIAVVLSGLGKVLGPLMLFLVEFIRIVAGVLIVVVGLSIALAMIIALGVILGLISSDVWFANQPFIMLDILPGSFPVITAVAAFFLIMVPAIFLLLLGISIIAKRIVFNATTGWSLFAVLIISGIILSANVPRIIYNFKEDGEHKETTSFTMDGKTVVLQMRETGMEDYAVVSLRLRGHEGQDYQLVQTFEAQGYSRKNAIENAQMVTYHVDLQDSILTFDSNIQFKKDALFRAQRLDLTLYIPYDTPFVVDDELRHIIRNTHGFYPAERDRNTWIITKDEGLECLTCPERNNENTHYYNESFGREYSFKKFDALEVESAFVINVVKAPEYKVGLSGNPDVLEQVDVYLEGGTLHISYEDHEWRDFNSFDRGAIDITVFSPGLNEIELSGACKLYMNNFTHQHLNLELNGASYARLSEVKITDLELELSGASELEIEGEGTDLEADLSGASQLNAYDFKVTNALIEAHGASSAKTFVTNELNYEETFASKVHYRGNPQVHSKSPF